MRYLLLTIVSIILSSDIYAQTKCTTDYFGDKHCTSEDGNTLHGTTDYFGDEIWTDNEGKVTKCTTDYFGDKHCS